MPRIYADLPQGENGSSTTKKPGYKDLLELLAPAIFGSRLTWYQIPQKSLNLAFRAPWRGAAEAKFADLVASRGCLVATSIQLHNIPI
jgi:hypothetical protein